MFRLQGKDPREFNLKIDETSLGQQIGNAMSVNVIERILIRAFDVAGLVSPRSLGDRWTNGEAMKPLRNLESFNFIGSPQKGSKISIESSSDEDFENEFEIGNEIGFGDANRGFYGWLGTDFHRF